MAKKKKMTGVDVALKLIALVILCILIFGLSIWTLYIFGAGVVGIGYMYDKQK